jgi:hypothetical protein
MNALALFGISVAFSFTAWSVVTGQYLWPRLRTLPQRDALRALLSLHTAAGLVPLHPAAFYRLKIEPTWQWGRGGSRALAGVAQEARSRRPQSVLSRMVPATAI